MSQAELINSENKLPVSKDVKTSTTPSTVTTENSPQDLNDITTDKRDNGSKNKEVEDSLNKGETVETKNENNGNKSNTKDAKEVDKSGDVVKDVHNVESEVNGSEDKDVVQVNAEEADLAAKMNTTKNEDLSANNNEILTVNNTVDPKVVEVKNGDDEVLEEYSEESSEEYINVDDLSLEEVRKKGSEHLDEKEYERAIVCLGRALELGIEAAGGDELAENLAELYLDYGHALLLNYEQSTDVLQESNGPATVTDAMKESQDIKAKVEQLLANRPVVLEKDANVEEPGTNTTDETDKNIEEKTNKLVEEMKPVTIPETESKESEVAKETETSIEEKPVTLPETESKEPEVAKETETSIEEKPVGGSDVVTVEKTHTTTTEEDKVKEGSNDEDADDSRAFQMLDIARSIFEKYVEKMVPRGDYRLMLTDSDVVSGGVIPDLSFIEKIVLPVDEVAVISEKGTEVDSSKPETVEKKPECTEVKDSTDTDSTTTMQTKLKIAENLGFVHRRLGELYLAQDQHVSALNEFLRGIRELECRFDLGIHPVCCRQISVLLAQCLQWLGHMKSAKLMYAFSRRLYAFIKDNQDEVLTKFRLPVGDESRTKASNVVEDLDVILNDIEIIIQEAENETKKVSNKSEINADENIDENEKSSGVPDDTRLTALKNSLPKGILESIEGTKNAFDESTFGDSETVVDVEPRRKKRAAEEPLEKPEAKVARVD